MAANSIVSSDVLESARAYWREYQKAKRRLRGLRKRGGARLPKVVHPVARMPQEQSKWVLVACPAWLEPWDAPGQFYSDGAWLRFERAKENPAG